MAAKVIKGPFNGPGPPEPKEVTATFLDAEGYEERGYKGMISIVELQNYNSRRSDDRLGFTTFGTIFVIRLFGRYFIRASKGCEKHSCTMTVLES